MFERARHRIRSGGERVSGHLLENKMCQFEFLQVIKVLFMALGIKELAQV